MFVFIVIPTMIPFTAMQVLIEQFCNKNIKFCTRIPPKFITYYSVVMYATIGAGISTNESRKKLKYLFPAKLTLYRDSP